MPMANRFMCRFNRGNTKTNIKSCLIFLQICPENIIHKHQNMSINLVGILGLFAITSFLEKPHIQRMNPSLERLKGHCLGHNTLSKYFYRSI